MNDPSNPSEIFTVSQLTRAIKDRLESAFPFVQLQGEIGNFKMQSSGHLYFSLKDSEAQIAAVMFKNATNTLKTMPKEGDKVIVKGEIGVYPPKGNYQLIVRELSYSGIGELLQQLENLKIKLHRAGWFKTVHKKPLPRFPRCIGVVTSPTGAVIQDILNVLTRRSSGFRLILNPVKVQGEGAPEEIARAIEQFNRYNLVDVMIIGRGGGSVEDLWAFNDEKVAAAIFHSRIPIISAVGHETDHCIADYVADVRAPTPSAAAEIVGEETERRLDYLENMRNQIHRIVAHRIQQYRFRIEGILKHPLFIRPHSLLEMRMQKLDNYRNDLDRRMFYFLNLKKRLIEGRQRQALALEPTARILNHKHRISDYERAFMHHILRSLRLNKERLERIREQLDRISGDKLRELRRQLFRFEEMLQAIDPKNLLQKGYSILFAEKSSSVIKSVGKLKPGQKARLLLSDGELFITVNEIFTSESNPSR